MVNTLLLTLVVLTAVAWIVQEWKARRQTVDNLKARFTGSSEINDDYYPAWYNLSTKVLVTLWCLWAVLVFVVKDGDFAVVMVVLTLFTGVISLVDKLFFQRLRQQYTQSLSQEPSQEKNAAINELVNKDFLVAEYAKSFFPVLLVVLLLRSFLVEPFQIPSSSMEPTLDIGDYILVNKFAYGIRLPVIGTKIVDVDLPDRGDVMVFFPPNDERYFIKRVIGLPGDKIRYIDKKLYINGELMPQTFLARYAVNTRFNENLSGVEHLAQTDNRVPAGDFETTVPANHYFMMGDNRDNSSDSRYWGTVPEENIVGKAFIVWMHWKSIKELPSFNRAGKIH